MKGPALAKRGRLRTRPRCGVLASACLCMDKGELWLLMREVEQAQLWRKRSLRPSKRRLPQGLLGKREWHWNPPRRVEVAA